MVKFAHIRIGGQVITAAVQDKVDAPRVAFAFCSPNDNWDRRKGNELALKRLVFDSSTREHIRSHSKETNYELAERILIGLIRTKKVPQWLRRAVAN